MPRVVTVIACMLLLALPGTGTAALDPQKALTQYRHDVWASDHGLPQNSIQDILQDRTGYLWLATQEGLVRFDGVSFTVFDRRNTPELRFNHILELLEGSDGGLWVGTYGAGVLRLRDGLFSAYSLEDGLSQEIVPSPAETPNGSVWAGTNGGGLNRILEASIRVYGEEEGLASSFVGSLLADSKGELWVGTLGDGLFRLDGDRIEEAYAAEGLDDADIRCLHETPAGEIWVGTTSGLYVIREGRLDHLSTADGLPHDIVYALYTDRHGNLWIGTNGGGLARFQHGRFETLRKADGLTSNFVLSLAEDREGSLWIGTAGGGLNRLSDGKFVTYSTREGLSSDFVRCVLQDTKGAMWFGTYGGGVSILRKGRFETLDSGSGLGSDVVRCLWEDSGGDIWAGTYGGGLSRISGGMARVYSRDDGLSNDFIFSVIEDRSGDIWVGTNGGGICRFRNGTFECFDSRDGLSSDFVLTLLPDRESGIWIGTDGGGLDRFRGGRFERLTTEDGLPNGVVLALHQDREGALWIGTNGGGLSRYAEGRLIHWTTREGIYDDAIFGIVEDRLENLWLTSNKGVFRVSRKSIREYLQGRTSRLDSLPLGKMDGMGSSECNAGSPAGCRSRDGRLWFPTIAGVSVLDPENLGGNAQPPPVIVEGLVMDSVPLDLSRGQQNLRFPPGGKNLEIHYTGLSFLAPSRVRFRYRLEGFNEDWVDAGTRRTAFFTNLPPGSHRFQVIACNNDGVWNEAGATLTFFIEPRFYQMTWFWAVIALILATAAAAGYVLRVRQLQRSRKRLALLVEDRTHRLREANAQLEDRSRQLAQANETLQRLSYLDPLTGIANRRNFEEALDLEWRRARRAGSPLSLIMVDIDFFKMYNDTYGHQKGDECLRRVAKALAAALRRAGDLVARYGGEEFAIILPGTDSEHTNMLAESMRLQISDLRISHEGSTVSDVLTISLGCASMVPDGANTRSDLLSAADEALYVAKQEGRNRIACHGGNPAAHP